MLLLIYKIYDWIAFYIFWGKKLSLRKNISKNNYVIGCYDNIYMYRSSYRNIKCILSEIFCIMYVYKGINFL